MRKHFEMAIVLESNRLLTSVADPNYNNSGRDLPQRFCQHGNGSGINFCFLRTQFWEILTVFLFNFNEKSYFSCRTCRDNLRWLNPPPPSWYAYRYLRAWCALAGNWAPVSHLGQVVHHVPVLGWEVGESVEHKVGNTLRNAGLLVRRFPQGSVNLEVTKKNNFNLEICWLIGSAPECWGSRCSNQESPTMIVRSW